MSIFARLKKRAAFPVGDTGLHIRELTFRQVENVQALEDPELKTWLTLAYCMVSAAGEREYPDAGSVEELARAVKADAVEHITPGVLNQIMQAMERLAKPANQEALQKN